MDPARRFRHRHSLHTMHTGFVLEVAIGPLTFDQRRDILISSDTILCRLDRIDLEAFLLRISDIRTE